MAVAFEEGRGVPPDLVAALVWYAIASRYGYAPAASHAEALAGELPSMEVREATRRVDEWWQEFGPQEPAAATARPAAALGRP